MRLHSVPWLLVGGVVALTVLCFDAALFRGEQPGYRDAGHFYYPLYERVEQEWDAGRIPLWAPEENAGMPLAGNPTAAVFYPGKLIYRLLPYAWGARIYIVAHVLLAAGAMYVLARGWDISRTGATLAALSYAFGAPVLFQYCNIIFLVGAAWAPFGLHAVDRLVRLRRRWGIVELAVVLAMQTLGGDPEASYITGLCAAGYAAGLAWSRGRGSLPSGRRVILALGLSLVAWVAVTLLAAWLMPGWYKAQGMDPALGPGARLGPPSPAWLPAALFGDRPGLTWLFVPWLVRRVATTAWGLVGLLVLRAWWRSKRQGAFGWSCLALLAAAGLGFLLMGAQLVPVLEFTSLSVRASKDGPHEIFPFSLEPFRVAELFWPKFFGANFGGNRNWLVFLPPPRTPKYWFPTIYVGGLTVVLALMAIRPGRAPAWRVWITAIGVVSLLLSVGECASPLWAARAVPSAARVLGTSDPVNFGEMRRDGYFMDATGSPYWLAAHLLPGFHSFRYPSKLLIFTVLALSVLAGAGWDRLLSTGGGRRLRLAPFLAGASVLGWLSVSLARGAILRLWKTYPASKLPSPFGPFDAVGAVDDLRGSLLHGAVLYACAFALLAFAWRRPRLAGLGAVALMTIDLGLTMPELVVTVPQGLFEARPEVLRLIEEAEKADPSDGPYRVHRMPSWGPVAWHEAASDRRVRDFVAWERKTVQPKYAIPYGMQYTLTEGTAELFDYWFFFAPFYGNHGPDLSRRLGLAPDERAVYYPRRGYDLWNSRYFILPEVIRNDEYRGIVSFLADTTPVAPGAAIRDDPKALERWSRAEDWRVLKNKNAFPRAWVVHQARFVPPIRGMGKLERKVVMEDILHQGDIFWKRANNVVYDPRSMAWVETDDPSLLQPFVRGELAGARERVKFLSYTPQRVEMEATLETPGLVVLADVYYPGWELTIDGAPATIHRTNRMMRGAAVGVGTHRLVYTYRPNSFRVGVALSLAGLVGLAVAGRWASRQGPSPAT